MVTECVHQGKDGQHTKLCKLILDPNSDDAQAILSRAVLSRAVRGEYALIRGASANKHHLISNVVFQLYNGGTLGDFIEPNGQFTIQGKFGFKREANIFQEIERGKELY